MISAAVERLAQRQVDACGGGGIITGEAVGLAEILQRVGWGSGSQRAGPEGIQHLLFGPEHLVGGIDHAVD